MYLNNRVMLVIRQIVEEKQCNASVSTLGDKITIQLRNSKGMDIKKFVNSNALTLEAELRRYLTA